MFLFSVFPESDESVDYIIALLFKAFSDNRNELLIDSVESFTDRSGHAGVHRPRRRRVGIGALIPLLEKNIYDDFLYRFNVIY